MRILRIYSIIIAALAASTLYGQTMYDAIRFSANDYEGTARSMAMGNAFTALGGDIGAITINPAATGVYRYNEFTITPSLTNTVDRSTYEGNLTKSNRTRFGLSNIGGVSVFDTGRKTGLISINLGVVANQTANFTSRSELSGTQSNHSKLSSMAYLMSEYGVNSNGLTMTKEDPNYPFYNSNALWEEILAWNTSLVETIYDEYTYIGATENAVVQNGEEFIFIGGPLRQSLYQETTGYKQDLSLNIGGNVSHKFYFGINLTLQSLWYHKYQNLSETAEDKTNFQSEFENFRHQYQQTINGIGFNMKAGVIYRPVAGLRLGATISTPTWTKYMDNNEENMESRVYNESFFAESPVNFYEYRIRSPFRWSLGAAYTFGNFALISIDYESTNYSSIRFKTSTDMYLDDIEYFNNQNGEMAKSFRRVNNIRAGLEIKPISQLSIRAGYNFLDTYEKGYNGEIHYATAGIGFIFKNGFFLDAAFRQQCNSNHETYTLYDSPVSSQPIVESKYGKSQVLLSLGLRF